MKSSSLGKITGIVGVAIAVFTGTIIVQSSTFGPHSWLLLPFAVGILLAAYGPVLKLQQQVEDLQNRLPGSDA